jgi:hypothetical protein
MASNKTDNAIICQVCGYKNLVGTLMCNNCGAMLSSGSRLGTRDLQQELPEYSKSDVFSLSGTSKFSEGMSVRLWVESSEQALVIKPDNKHKHMMIGRRDGVSQHMPDIDMEDYEGYRLGVSRKHAQLILEVGELNLQDFGSANGTYINGVRLPAHRPHKLHDGDEVRLGNLTLRVYFV